MIARRVAQPRASHFTQFFPTLLLFAPLSDARRNESTTDIPMMSAPEKPLET